MLFTRSSAVSRKCQPIDSLNPLSGTSTPCLSLNNILLEKCKIPSTSKVRIQACLHSSIFSLTDNPFPPRPFPSPQIHKQLASLPPTTTRKSKPSTNQVVSVPSVIVHPFRSRNQRSFYFELIQRRSRRRCCTRLRINREDSSRRRCIRLTGFSGELLNRVGKRDLCGVGDWWKVTDCNLF